MTKDEREQIADFYGLMTGHVCDKQRFFEMLQLALSTFVYDGLPDTIPAEFLEGYLICNGTVGIGKIAGDLYCAPGGFCGDYNGYLPDSYLAEVLNKGTLSGKWGLDLVVGYNNATRTPDFDILQTGDILKTIDRSELIVTIFTRLLRIPKAASDAEAAAINEAINSLLDGDLHAIASDNTLQDILQDIGSGRTDNRFLDLVDPQQVDQLQYLNQYHDNVLKRFLLRRGHAMQITSKLAQQTNAEMHGTDSICMIYPLQQLHYRELMCKQVNKMFGTDISVQFNDLVKNSYDIAVNYVPDELNEREVIPDGESTDDNNAGSAQNPAEPAGADGNSAE